MSIVSGITGVPDYRIDEFAPKRASSCLLIPVINEGDRVLRELERARDAGIPEIVDIVICDGGSTDGSLEPSRLRDLGVIALIEKLGPGRQGAQLRTGIHHALARGYENILTIDGNDKDSIEDVPRLLDALEAGFDFVQGSRFVEGGRAINTPFVRTLAVRLIHAPITSLAARHRFTDTTNNFRGYRARYLRDPRVAPLRDIFSGYELIAYLAIRATQLGYSACEVPVTRAYPEKGATPTKISPLKGNSQLMSVLLKAVTGAYDPLEKAGEVEP